MSKTATLAKIAIALATQQKAQMAKMAAKAETSAVPLKRDSVATPLAQDMVREMFAIEAMVRGVVADMKDELRGQDGRNVEPAEAEAIVRQVFAEMRPGLKGKDGKNVEPAQAEALVRSVFAEMASSLKGEPGASVDLVQVSAMVRHSLDAMGHVKPTAEAMQAAVKAEVQMIAPDLRGAEGRPGLIWKGEWQRGTTYARGEVVRYRRATYVALEETVGAAPGSDKRRWELMVRDGEDGSDGGGGGGGFVPATVETATKWTLANTDYPYFGYTHAQQKWKIEKITPEGVATVARPENNGGIEYAAAWAARTTLNYAGSGDQATGGSPSEGSGPALWASANW